ncbi:MAG: DEAD/DEAH box helicase [Leptospirales bacterium]|nr:DEAD/DEAH box helicase [Leptospirales bacterium]
MKFADTELHPDLRAAIAAVGFSDLTPIQEQCLGPLLEGRDIAGISQTGTGKTLAFLLPVLNRIYLENVPGPIALVVTPTRELCLQIAEEAQRMLSGRSAEVVAIYGGEEYRKQEQALARAPSIIAATPGRLIDYMKQGKVDLGGLRYLILDEADRMFDMGFIRDVRYIMRHAPENAQTMLFSATLSYYVMRLAADYMKDPVEIRIESESVAVDKIDQRLLHLGRHEKDPYLVNQILAVPGMKAIVFSNYKHRVQHIVRVLQRKGIAATGISSLLDQKKRVRLLKDFKLGHYTVLVATDVASRGLDVDDITHVFNYDLPQDSESYVHRIGRTARAGKSGVSVSYCSEEDYENLPRIQRYLGVKIPVDELNTEYLQYPEGEREPFRDPNHRDEESEERGASTESRGDDSRSRGSRRRRGRGRSRESEAEVDGNRAEPEAELDDDIGNRRRGSGQRPSAEPMSVRERDRLVALHGAPDYEDEYRRPAGRGGRDSQHRRNGREERGNQGDRSGRSANSEEQGGGRRRGRGRRGRSNRERTDRQQKPGLWRRILAFFGIGRKKAAGTGRGESEESRRRRSRGGRGRSGERGERHRRGEPRAGGAQNGRQPDGAARSERSSSAESGEGQRNSRRRRRRGGRGRSRSAGEQSE